jgi:hypothetical protein
MKKEKKTTRKQKIYKQQKGKVVKASHAMPSANKG